MSNKSDLRTQPKASEQDDDLLIDTKGMSEGQAEALQVAESAREKEWRHPSFGSELFLGNFRADMLAPFPRQSPEEKKIGDEYIAKLEPILREYLDPEAVDETRTIPAELLQKLTELGAFAMKIPKEYDGLGFTQVNYNRVMQLVGSYCGSTAVLLSAHQSIGVPIPLKLFGTEEQKKKFLPLFRQGAISAFALTEPDVGSDPAKMKTEAKLSEDGKHYILNGEKLWCTNGPIADIMVIMAKTEPKIVRGKERQQITAFILDTKTEGIERVHRCDFMGLRGINNGWLRFKDVKIPVENIIWGKGRGLALALTTLNTGRLTVPAACTGMAKQAVSIARRWGNERVQWGDPVGFHEAGSQKVAFIASSELAMEAVTWVTSHWADEGDKDIRIEAAFAKLFCSEMAWQVADTTLQFRGGRGYERARSLEARGEVAYPVERMMRDTRINTIIEGTSDIMRLFLAREAIDPHLKVAAGLIKPRSSFGEKMSALGGMLGFYSTWYPKQWINGSLFRGYPNMGRLAKHFCFVERTSHKLARKIFHAMGKYQQKLEKEQVLLGHLTDIGMELFAIAATCSYAKSLSDEKGGDQTPIELADYFAQCARSRIARHFYEMKYNEVEQGNKVAKKVLEGEMRWQEEGVMWMGPKD